MRKLLSIALTTISIVWTTHGAQAQEYGKYVGEVIARWQADGRSMELLANFSYLDPKGIQWDAPIGSIVDGASIPQFAWSIIGGPFEGKYREASVIHDVACDEHKRPWQDVHKAFYTAMMASSVNSLKAKVMYGAVYHFGPRWTVVREIVQASSPESVQRGCINLSGDMSTCVEVPATPGVSQVFRNKIEVPPAPRELQQDDFGRLAKEIESREAGPTPMSLEEIDNYK